MRKLKYFPVTVANLLLLSPVPLIFSTKYILIDGSFLADSKADTKQLIRLINAWADHFARLVACDYEGPLQWK